MMRAEYDLQARRAARRGSALLLLIFVTSASSGCNSYFGRLVRWRESDAGDVGRFRNRPIHAGPQPFSFAPGADEIRVHAAFSQAVPTESLEAYLERNGTQAFLVIQDDTILYERYFNGTERGSIVTSFSMAKSFASALVGKAIEEGYINSVDDPVTRYLPELAARDERFSRITIRDLLMMSSGIHYGGRWGAAQVLPSSWVLESTSPDTTVDYHAYYPTEDPFAGRGYY